MTDNGPRESPAMSRRQVLVRGTLLATAAAVGGGVSLPPAAVAGGSALTYSDDFHRADGGDVGPGWRQLRGSWSIVDDTLRPTGNSAQMQIAQTAFELGRTFTVEATVSAGAPGGVHSGVAFNIHDRGNGNQDCYALTLSYGNPSVWALFNIENSAQRFLPAFKEIDIEPDHPYTLRATASRYGSFHVAILDGDTALVDEDVDLDPYDAQLAGGYFGLYSQAGDADGLFQVYGIEARSTTEPSSPPAPPAAAPLVCVPVQGPPYQLPGSEWTVVGASQADTTQPYVAVGQGLLTTGTTQYVVYYDANREMTVAQRTTGSDTWIHQPLGNYVGTDGHNSVGFALDRDGQLHVAGNMHNVPLIYFRTATAGDATTLTKIASMVDPDTEQSETYPVFLYNADGQLIYNYRSGVSGNGATYYNIYDESTRTWSRLLDQPLFDGQGAGNAYPSGPALGPDGRFHMVWVWRATGDAATNHTLCYARSADLVHWETVDGDPLSLPITQSTKGVVVDPIPVYDGLLNGVPTIGFDAGGTVLISYYKIDKRLDTQVYVARPARRDRWQVVQVSEWTGRYYAEGIGTIPPQPLVSPVGTLPDGNLQLAYSYEPSAAQSYSGTWILDPGTLKPFTEAPLEEILRFGNTPLPNLPAELTTVRSTFPGMAVQLRPDSGSSGSAAQQYFLRYEALPAPVSGTQPAPGPLQVYLVQSS
jgi:putative BNR repeat neuraminidase